LSCPARTVSLDVPHDSPPVNRPASPGGPQASHCFFRE
jgi:hypothetical protein